MWKRSLHSPFLLRNVPFRKKLYFHQRRFVILPSPRRRWHFPRLWNWESRSHFLPLLTFLIAERWSCERNDEDLGSVDADVLKAKYQMGIPFCFFFFFSLLEGVEDRNRAVALVSYMQARVSKKYYQISRPCQSRVVRNQPRTWFARDPFSHECDTPAIFLLLND